MMVLLALLVMLMVSNVLYTRESLLFCERALYGEVEAAARNGKTQLPLRFTDICPEHRQRTETAMNKWLEVILALLVQIHPPSDP